MSGASSTTSLALVGPKRPPAAASRRAPNTRIERFSLDGYLAAGHASDLVALCPRGDDLDADLAFLRAAKARLLWPAPPRDIADAIGGLLTDAPPATGRPPLRRTGPLSAALLLEGGVTRGRAHASLASPVRLWVVESVRCVRLSDTDLAELARAGVRWAALRPVKIVGLIASPALAKARSRWGRWLGARLPVWIVS